MGYRTIALWSLQMLESVYQTPQLVRYIVDHAGAGHIILAHDTGDPQRLRAIDGIQDMVAGLRRRGYEFVRLSDLLREQQA
jgi:peptidoglycan/xylan/chitin deacetylase (PgdA/CDA1 family)